MPPSPPQPPANSPEAVVRRFMAAINRHDIDALDALIADDHAFIDASGDAIRGRDSLRSGWRAYFAWFPNYEVHADRLITDGDTVAVFGRAGGTFAAGRGTVGDNTWLLPAAWRAVVHAGRLTTWQVYCDTERIWAIMRTAHEGPKDHK